MIVITKEDFFHAIGTFPENDDLERCNCTEKGLVGHSSCGWCFVHNKPIFMCGCETHVRRRSNHE